MIAHSDTAISGILIMRSGDYGNNGDVFINSGLHNRTRLCALNGVHQALKVFVSIDRIILYIDGSVSLRYYIFLNGSFRKKEGRPFQLQSPRQKHFFVNASAIQVDDRSIKFS